MPAMAPSLLHEQLGAGLVHNVDGYERVKGLAGTKPGFPLGW